MTDSLTGRRIVIVDDHPDTLDMLTQACESQDAVVQSTSSAREALDLIARTPPDVVITDIGLRGEDGVWLLNEIRRHHPKIPVLALTGRGPEDALAAGFDAVLLKPTDPWELCDELRRLLRARPTA